MCIARKINIYSFAVGDVIHLLSMPLLCSSLECLQVFITCCHSNILFWSMSRCAFNLHSGNCLCHRCGRPSNPLSSRDVETGWMGWCMVCNAYWHHHNVMSSIKCCSRVCSVIWPVVCGLGLYIPVAMAIKINAYLFADQLRLDSQSLPLVVLHQSTSTSSESLQAVDWYDDT